MLSDSLYTGRIAIQNAALFFYHSLLDVVYPPWCVLCGCQVMEPNRCVCRDCDSGIPRLQHFCIPATEMDVPDAEQLHFQRIISVYTYHESLRHLVHLFKYQQCTVLVRYLGHQLCCALSDLDQIDHDMVIPTPLHPVRQRERGYNQSRLLAEFVAKKLGLPLQNGNLQRVRYTIPQAKQDRHARIRNLHGAFRVKNADRLAGCRILLVDDVVTTGSTVNECARVLLESGACAVDVLSLARVEKRLS